MGPFRSGQPNILVDIRSGAFGSFGPFPIKILQKSDFQAPTSKEAVGVIENKPLGEQYLAWLDSTAFPYIAQADTIQLRLRFNTGDNNISAPGYLEFYSGDSEQEDRPQLLIEYYQRKINK